jgi:LPS-assembly protein
MLFPEIDSSGATGIVVVAPVFVTLGEHADLTLSPGWAFGPSREGGDADPAVRGPTGTLEVRWAPAVGAAGIAEVTWLHDQIAEPGGASGDRFGLTLRHQQGSIERFAFAADVALDEDGVLHRDLTPGRTARSATYQRSSLLASLLAGPALLQAGTGYLQALQPDGVEEPYGIAGVDVPLAQPLAWASATLPPTALGPLLASGRGGVGHFSPVHGGDDLAGRPAASRIDARLQLEVPLLLGRAVAFSPFVRAAAVGYPGAGIGDGVAWGLAGAALSSEVSRAFGTLRHTMGASADWRLGTPTFGDAPTFPAFDALDRVEDAASTRRLTAAPPGRFHQARLAVNTRLSRAGTTLARLTLGRDLDLGNDAAGDAFVAGALALGPVRGDATVRFPDLTRYGEVSARLALGEPRGHRLHAEYVGVRGPGSRLQTAGIDVLFDPRPLEQGQATQATAGAQLALGPALLGYQVIVPGRDGITRAGCGTNPDRTLGAFEIYEQLARLTWDSPCRCFRAGVQLEVDSCGNVTGLKGKLEIARLGERASVP